MDKELHLQKLVELYLTDPSETVRSQIVVRSMPLVKSIIGRIHFPNATLMEMDDVESVAVMGLIEALNQYDLTKKTDFSTFAFYRIRGSVIDYMRSIDHLPRSDRNLYGRVKSAVSALQQTLGRHPSDEEICQHLNIDQGKLNDLMVSVQQRVALSLHPGGDDQEGGDRIESDASMMEARSEEASDQQESLVRQLTEVIKRLPERDRVILTLYYYENLTLKEIGLLVKVSEARVSQILGKLLIQLKAAMTA
jgi:RNA polymerase sigma factor for flagellar operon FliA